MADPTAMSSAFGLREKEQEASEKQIRAERLIYASKG
jgi:hypothetical protein